MAKQSFVARFNATIKARGANGAKVLAFIEEAINGYDANGDWTNMAWMVSRMDSADANRVKRIMTAVCGVEFKANKKSSSGLRCVFPDETGESNAVATNQWTGRQILAAHVKAGSRFTGVALENDMGEVPALLVKSVKAEKTLEGEMSALVAKYVKAGKSLKQIDAAYAAATMASFAAKAA